MRALLLCLALLSPLRAAWAEEVDLVLALVSDVSRSIDDSEFAMQKDGIRSAFASPQVLAAIRGGPIGAIAVTYIEFAGAAEARSIVGWMVINDEPSARRFADAVSAARRSAYGRTSISSGIDAAADAIKAGAFISPRRVIDVAGDGTNNSGRDVSEARDAAIYAGITINGLAIINDRPVSWSFAHVQPPGGLDNWYRDNVTGGPGSFVIAIHDFRDFAEALTRKLVNEIAALPPYSGQMTNKF